MTATDFEAVIGLEIHAELNTQSKMFCGCRVEQLNEESNTTVCPVCLGLPGALPVANRTAIEMSMLVGLALGCQISPVTYFARKNYFYPDLPKGYQISQFDDPIAHSGSIDVPDGDQTIRIRVRRAHLEEDTAKLSHEHAGRALVDFNRSSVPLLEIVTEPDIRSAEVALGYGTRIRSILRYLGVNSGDMEKGVLRFEANVSIRPRGSDELNTRTEIKNLNSFRSLTGAIEKEIERQIEVVTSGGTIVQETLGWDENKERVYSQRSKEHAHDYRYFPEPDLPPFRIDADWVEQVRSRLPELAEAKRSRFQSEYNLSEYDADLLASEREVASYFESAVEAYPSNPKAVSNWMTGELFRLLKEHNTTIGEIALSSERFAALVGLVDTGKLSPNNGKEVLAEIFTSGDDPAKVVEAKGLSSISDTDELSGIIDEVLDKNPDQVGQFLGGKDKVLQWLLGQVMRATRGKARPDVVKPLLEQALKARR